MAAHLDLSELVDAVEWVSAAGPFENAAYVSRESGRIFWATDTGELEEELPEDVDDGTLYVAVPHKNDFDLGQKLVFRFVEDHVPEVYDQVRGYFSKRGGYARLKELLERRGVLEAWYSYEQRAVELALREWAESEHFEVVERQRGEGK